MSDSTDGGMWKCSRCGARKLNMTAMWVCYDCVAKEYALQAKLDDAADAFHKLDNWAKAYPLDMFPVPDLEKARKLLMDGGITLDAVSATAMRHVISGVAYIVQEALKKLEDTNGTS